MGRVRVSHKISHRDRCSVVLGVGVGGIEIGVIIVIGVGVWLAIWYS